MDVLAITEKAQEALDILRDGDTFQWSTVTLLGLALYVYAVEVERRRWDIFLAGLAFWLMDWFNELVNSAVFHASDRAPLWTVTGDTSFLILIGLNIEICLLFLVSGVVFVKSLPPRALQRGGERVRGLRLVPGQPGQPLHARHHERPRLVKRGRAARLGHSRVRLLRDRGGRAVESRHAVLGIGGL